MALEMDQHFVHDLMLELLQMPPARAVVGRALLSALRRTPPHEPWLANVLRPIEAYSPKIEPFLHAAVASLSDANSQGVLIETAADILLDSLRRLDDERRGAPWVPGALEWIGAHGSLSALDFLEHVQKERKFLRPTWSKECRRAASAGIQRGWGEA